MTLNSFILLMYSSICTYSLKSKGHNSQRPKIYPPLICLFPQDPDCQNHIHFITRNTSYPNSDIVYVCGTGGYQPTGFLYNVSAILNEAFGLGFNCIFSCYACFDNFWIIAISVLHRKWKIFTGPCKLCCFLFTTQV